MIVYCVECAYPDDTNQSWTEAVLDTKEKADKYTQLKLKDEQGLHETEKLLRWVFEVEIESD